MNARRDKENHHQVDLADILLNSPSHRITKGRKEKSYIDLGSERFRREINTALVLYEGLSSSKKNNDLIQIPKISDTEGNCVDHAQKS